MFGDTKSAIPDHIRIFNKVGWAYGYLTDAAYIVDFKNKVEFILAATINTNTDGIFNDGNMNTKPSAYPTSSRLGRVIYNHELQRKRNHTPDLKGIQTQLPRMKTPAPLPDLFSNLDRNKEVRILWCFESPDGRSEKSSRTNRWACHGSCRSRYRKDPGIGCPIWLYPGPDGYTHQSNLMSYLYRSRSGCHAGAINSIYWSGSPCRSNLYLPCILL